mmetsp:Transcript_7978/g.26210  ORF Transcript_7978/g.26210 Transcript_7978/m.26210 type:complete len:202 (+) Transcript_7978:237-842(+)
MRRSRRSRPARTASSRAYWRGVWFRWFVALGSAPYSRRVWSVSRTFSTSWGAEWFRKSLKDVAEPPAQRWRGVLFSTPALGPQRPSTRAPRARRTRTARCARNHAARCKGRQSSSPVASTAAPPSISISRIVACESTWQHLITWCRAVSWSLSRTFHSAGVAYLRYRATLRAVTSKRRNCFFFRRSSASRRTLFRDASVSN